MSDKGRSLAGKLDLQESIEVLSHLEWEAFCLAKLVLDLN
jgi:hypothetical protein